jgi:hypothetical protein
MRSYADAACAAVRAKDGFNGDLIDTEDEVFDGWVGFHVRSFSCCHSTIRWWMSW